MSDDRVLRVLPGGGEGGDGPMPELTVLHGDGEMTPIVAALVEEAERGIQHAFLSGDGSSVVVSSPTTVSVYSVGGTVWVGGGSA